MADASLRRFYFTLSEQAQEKIVSVSQRRGVEAERLRFGFSFHHFLAVRTSSSLVLQSNLSFSIYKPEAKRLLAVL